MGTTVFERFGLQVRRFYGGDIRGVCFQLTMPTEYIQVTRSEFFSMMEDLNRVMRVELSRIKTVDNRLKAGQCLLEVSD